MCGISGIVDYNTNASVNKELIHRMCASLSHRGPDDEGVYISASSDPSVGLGHRRLSIIDLSPSGHQPMSNEDGSILIVLNGEIYNYRELRDDLKKKGHIFKSNSDTEVALHLYEEYKEDFVKFLRGMFAFAIWDNRQKALILGRDRAGKKPLLYFYDNNRFVFSSEFESILKSDLVERSINYQAIDYYLTFGYIPAPLTIYKKVFKLLPAYILILKNNVITTKPYWQLDYSKKIKISEEDAAQEVLRLLKEAVKIRLYSDVPLGAFLSGGIDSSTVVALMAQECAEKVKTFSIGFEEKDYNELHYAKLIADRFGTDHHEFIVRPDAVNILDLLVTRYGEPYADSSCIPTYYVANQTRQFVTVALNGDGGDEVFGGYEHYRWTLASEVFRKFPSFIKSSISKPLNLLADLAGDKSRLRHLKKFFKGTELGALDRYISWFEIFDADFKDSLYLDEFKDKIKGTDPKGFVEPHYDRFKDISPVEKILYTDYKVYLPDDLLVKVDIASMANSLEARSPFLDHKLIEFTASLPANYKVKGLVKKYILKKAVKGILPEQNLARKKMGFEVPVDKWLRADLKEDLEVGLFSKKSLGSKIFKEDALKALHQRHLNGDRSLSRKLWALLMLEKWHEKFIG